MKKLRKEEKNLKSWLKRKITIDNGIIIKYLMLGVMGLFVSTTSVYAATYFHTNNADPYQRRGNANDNSGSVEEKAGAVGSRAITAGIAAKAEEANSIAIGYKANAKSKNTIAIGSWKESDDPADKDDKTLAKGQSSIAIGSDAIADISKDTKVNTDDWGVLQDGQEMWDGQPYSVPAIAIGGDAKALSRNAIAIGTQAEASANRSLAIGSGARTEGENSIAFGGAAKTAEVAKKSVAIGRRSESGYENSVALGASSKDKDAVSTNDAIVGPLTYSGFAGVASKANGVVSIGDATKERQLVNVAAGQIIKTSTDAINGSQLYATNNALGNTAGTVTKLLGGNAKLTPNGDDAGSITFTDIGETGKDNIHDAIKKLKDDIANAGGADINSVEDVTGTGSISVTTAADRTDGIKGKKFVVSLTDKAEKAIAKVGTGVVAAGNQNTVTGDVVNTAIETVKEEVKSDDKSITVVTSKNADGANVYDVSVKVDDNTLEFVPDANGNKKLKAKIEKLIPNVTNGKIDAPGNPDGLVTAGDVVKAINESFWKTTSANDGGELAGVQTIENIKAGDTVTFKSGKNIKLSQAGKNFTYMLKDDLTGLNTVILGDTKGDNVVSLTKAGINAGNKKITNVAKGTDNEDAVNLKQLKDFMTNIDKVSAVEVKNNSPFAYVYDKPDGTTVSLERTVDPVTKKVVYKHAGAPVDVKNEDVYISTMDPATGNPVIPTKVANVKEGVKDTDAVNVKQLKESKEEVKSTDKSVTVVTSKNADGANVYDVSVKVDNDTLEFVPVDPAKPDGAKKLKAKTTTLIPSTTDGTVVAGNKKELATAGDIATAINGAGFIVKTTNGEGTEDKLITMGNTVEFNEGKNINIVQSGNKFTVKTKDNLTKLNSVVLGKKIGDNVVSLTKDGINAGNKTISNVGSGMKDANGNEVQNLDDAKDTNAVNIGDLKKVIKANKKAKLGVGKGTTIEGDGTENSPYKVNVDFGEVKEGNKKAVTGGDVFTAITGAKTLVDIKDDSKDILTIKKIHEADDLKSNSYKIGIDKDKLIANSNITYKSNDRKAKNISLKDGFNFKDGDNTTATVGDKGEIKYNVNKDLKNMNSVVLGDKISGNVVSLTKDGLNNGGNKITNVAAGTEPTDAVNVSQLEEIKGNIGEIDNKINSLGATSSAMTGLEFMEIGINQATVGAAIGTYGGNQAVAVGVQTAPTVNTRVHAKVAVSSSGHKKTMANIGATWRFNWK